MKSTFVKSGNVVKLTKTLPRFSIAKAFMHFFTGFKTRLEKPGKASLFDLVSPRWVGFVNIPDKKIA